MGCNCGKPINRAGRTVGRHDPDERKRPYVDPTRAAFAAGRTSFLVVQHAGARTGKRFSTLAAAQAYAQRTHGILRPI